MNRKILTLAICNMALAPCGNCSIESASFQEIPNRPQEPKLPLPYTEEHVSYDNLEAGVTLSGTLTLPASKGPCPAVLLIAGSGPIDRDETVYGHKPFFVLADHLTRQGIAVLRYDKRGCEKSTGNYEKATTQDFSDDALAGVAYIKSRKEVNPNQIGLIGHSEGGIIAPMVAAKSKDVAFVVLMAGTGVNGEEIIYEQNTLILRAVGETEDTINQSRKFKEQMCRVVKSEPDPQIAAAQLQEIADNYMAIVPETQEKETLEYFKRLATRLNTDWFRYYLTLDPIIALKQVRVPTLVLNGELDLQVSPKQNLPAISKALEGSGNKDFTIIELPKLNHFFQTCETGSIGEYEKIEETISPLVLSLITEWVLERTVQDKENDDRVERNLNEQPIARILAENNLTSSDVVSASTENITYKMLSRACKGRRLTPHVQVKICNALNKATGKSFTVKDLFNY